MQKIFLVVVVCIGLSFLGFVLVRNNRKPGQTTTPRLATPNTTKSPVSKKLDFKPIFGVDNQNSVPTRMFKGTGNIVINSDAAWKTFWDQPFYGDTNATVPSVDFSKYTVIVVYTSANSGGYSIAIDDITEQDNILVKYHITRPGIHCITTQSFTYPHFTVTIPKTTRSVEFEKTDVVNDC